MRVLQIVPGSLWAGMERQVVALCAGLAHQGVDLRAALWHERETAAAIKKLGIPVTILPQGSRGRSAVVPLHELIQKEKIDIVHSHGYKANYVAWKAAGGTGAKLVRTEHGMPEPFVGWAATKMQFYRYLDRRAARATDRVVYVSRDLRRRLKLPVPDKRTTVWHNVLPEPVNATSREDARRELDLPIDATVIGSAGRFVPVKDFSTFIDISVRMKDTGRFVLFGDGPERTRLQQENRRNGGVVEFLGFRADLPSLLPALDIFLFTSRDEGLPTVLLEALACGVAVVAPRVGGIPEVLDGDLSIGLADGRTPDMLADACHKILSRPDMRASYAEAAKKRAAEFTPAQLGARAQALYAELLA